MKQKQIVKLNKSDIWTDETITKAELVGKLG